MPVSFRPAYSVRALFVALALLLAACGGTPPASDSTTNPTPAPITSDAEPSPTAGSEAEAIATTPPESPDLDEEATSPVDTAPDEATSAPQEASTAGETTTTSGTGSSEAGPAGEEENASGGYAYQTPSGWTAQALGNTVVMRPADAPEDDDTAPTFVLEGGMESGLFLEDPASVTTLDGLFDVAVSAFESGDSGAPEVSEREDITVDGVPGVRATVRFKQDTDQLEGQAIVVLAGPTRPFVMVGAALEEQWAETEPVFEETLGAIRLFEPAAAPEPTAEPSPEPAQPGSSRSAPLELGTMMQFETWVVTVTETLRGEEAAAAVAQANQFNEPPAEGNQFVVATLQMENISSEQEPQEAAYALGLRITGDRNLGYNTVPQVAPQPLDAELAPGGATEGQVVFEVPADETNLMFMLSENFSFDGDVRFVAIDPGASIAPDPALAELDEVDLGQEMDAPAKVGETLVTAGFEVTALEFFRGEEAATRVTEASEFNDPPDAGMEFVMVRVRVRYVDTTNPDLPQFVDQGFFKLIGDRNEAYDAVSATSLEGRLDALLFPGGSAEGWVVLEAGEGEQNLVVIVQPFLSFEDEEQRYIALE